MFVVALSGLAAYMVSVGWSQANLIAGVAGLFVAVVGLALALEARHSTAQQGSGQIKQQMRDVHAKNVTQDAYVLSGESLSQDMAGVTARNGSVEQRIRAFTRLRARGVRRGRGRDD